MRRPPEVGLLILLLLGISGCAGVQQRLVWCSSSKTGGRGAEVPTGSGSAWWHRTESLTSLTSNSLALCESSNAASVPDATILPLDIWSARWSEGLSHYFPLLTDQRNASGSAFDHAHSGPDVHGDVNVGAGCLQPPTVRGARPADASGGADVATGSEVSPASESGHANPRLVSLPVHLAFRPHSSPESSGEVEPEVSGVWHEESCKSPARTQPVEGFPTTQHSLAQEEVASCSDTEMSGQISTAEQHPSEPRVESGHIPVSAPTGWGALLAMDGAGEAEGDLPPTGVTDGAPAASTTMERESARSQATNSSSSILVALPSRWDTPTRSTPRLPRATLSLAPVERPRARTQPAETPTVSAAPAVSRAEAASPPAREARHQAVAAFRPTASAPQQPSASSDHEPVGSFVQTMYASPPPMASPPPRRKWLNWALFEENRQPNPSPDSRSAAFLASYGQSGKDVQRVAPTAVQDSALCAAAHQVSCWKPGMIMGSLIEKLKSWKHDFGCSGCQNGHPPSCCHACCGGENQPVDSSSQAQPPAATDRRTSQGVPASRERTTAFARPSMSSPEMKLATSSSQGSPASPSESGRSAEIEAGDVAEGGKVVDAVVPQNLDKAPQG